MITRDELLAMGKEECGARSATLSEEDIRLLAGLLDAKDDTVRYHAFLLLQRRSQDKNDVYPHIGVFCGKLASSNSYQRSIGAMLVSTNASWDADGKIDSVIGDFLGLLYDKKPITVRQCLQALVPIIEHKPALRGIIAGRLIAFDIMAVKETMRKSILLDILGALMQLRQYGSSDEIEGYIYKALSGGILDKKSIKDIEVMLRDPLPVND